MTTNFYNDTKNNMNSGLSNGTKTPPELPHLIPSNLESISDHLSNAKFSCALEPPPVRVVLLKEGDLQSIMSELSKAGSILKDKASELEAKVIRDSKSTMKKLEKQRDLELELISLAKQSTKNYKVPDIEAILKEINISNKYNWKDSKQEEKIDYLCQEILDSTINPMDAFIERIRNLSQEFWEHTSEKIDQKLIEMSAFIEENFHNNVSMHTQIYENLHTLVQVEEDKGRSQMNFPGNGDERKSLKELRDKKNLSFDVKACPKEDEIKNIRLLVLLEATNQVSLSFGKGISEAEFQTTLGLISLGFPSIETLRLDLEDCENITDTSILHFYDENIAKMVKLKDLTLTLKGTQASSKALELFRNKAMQSIENLNLELEGLKVSDNKFIEIIAEVDWEKLVKLKTLKLGLKCEDLSGDILDDLRDGLLNKSQSIEKITVVMNNKSKSNKSLDLRQKNILEYINDFRRP